MGGCNKCNCCLLCLTSSCFITGLVLVGSAVALMFVFPIILESQVEERVVIQPGSATFQQLLSPTVPLFKDIYFFNLTNPAEFQNGAKPNLTEIGPYSYRETRVKTVLNTSADGSLLTYNQTRIFNFSPETSGAGLRETDTICTINIPLVAAVAQLQDAMILGDSQLLRPIVDGISTRVLQGILNRADAELFICQPATALAFSYTDELVQDLNSNLILRAVDLNYPRTDVSIQLNNSANNSLPSTIHTGVGDINSIGQYVQWQGNVEELMVWPNGMGANDINGTEGLFFHPFLQEGEQVEIFVDDTFRSFTLVHVDTVNLMGVEAFRFTFVNSTFQSAFTNPENARWGSFNPDGLFFLGPTQDPIVPVFGSKPHFLDGDPILLEKVNGLKPNRELHESFLDVEPTTGANVQVQIQIQINVQVNQSSDIEQLENVNGTVYLPVLYINQHTVLTQSFVDFLMDNGLSEINLFSTLVRVMFGVLIAIAAVCFLISLSTCISFICRVHKLQDSDLKKNTTTNQQELTNVAELGRAAPITIVHHVPLQNQDQPANANTDANANTTAYDSFESDDEDDPEPSNAPERGIYPNVNNYDQNQNDQLQGNYPEGTYTFYQDQNSALQQEYADELEDGEMKYDIVPDSSNDVSESDYIKQELET